MKKIFLPVLALVLAAACVPDERNQFIPADSFGVTAKSLVTEASVHTGSYTVGIAKNGKGQQPGTVFINQDQDAYLPLLEAFNKEKGTHYEAVLGSLIDVEKPELSFGKEDVVKNLSLTWDPELMAAFMGNKENYVIPILIDSKDLGTSNGRQFMLVHLNRSSVGVNQLSQARTIERKKVEASEENPNPELKEDILLDVTVTNPIKGVGMTFPLVLDPTLTEKFNKTQEIAYETAPEGLVTLPSDKVSIAEGTLGATFSVRINKDLLLENGKLKDFPPYVAAVRLDNDGLSATLGGKPFKLQGLSYGNMVTYITIAPAEKGISVVVREWGLYSEGAAWYSELDGFAGGADRTVAMDKDYVYVSHSAAAGGIYALSRTSGAFVKKLNIGTAADKGCTFPVSCVRTIKNTDGDDILTFCTLKGDSGQHLFVYAYVNGTDAAPVQLLDFALDNKGGVEDWRRYGDRYTVTGTWQDGQLWFQTWSDGGTAKTIGFILKNGAITNPADPVDYYIAGPKAGIKDVVWYPGWDNVLITENGKGTFYKAGSAGPNGWTKWDEVESLPELSLTYGYNFFEFHEERFIAYVQLEGENAVRGQLVIIDDTSLTPADFPAQLKAQANARRFPLQHEEDFEAKSSVTAASSVADCTVWEIGGNTYIATLMQGCGLSVFQLQ